MATHSSILAKKSHRQGILLGYSPWVCERVRRDSANKQQQILIVIQSQYRIISSPQETTPAPTLDSSFSFTSTFSSSFPVFLKQFTDICFGKNKCLHGVNPFVSGLLWNGRFSYLMSDIFQFNLWMIALNKHFLCHSYFISMISLNPCIIFRR